MQEGILSLMQLPKTVCAVEDLHDAGGCRSSACWRTRRPAACSRASRRLGDVTIAEPGALIVVHRPARRPGDHAREAARRLRPRRARTSASATSTRSSPDPSCARTWRGSCGSSMPGEAELRLRERLGRLQEPAAAAAARASRGELRAARAPARADREPRRPTRRSGARSSSRGTPDRPYTLDYVERIARRLGRAARRPRPRRRRRDRRRPRQARRPDDRRSSASRRAATSRSATQRQFGMPYPEGYAKAMRVMELADRFGFPVVTLVDTPGRLPGRRRRAARAGRRDRPLAGDDGAPRRADGRLRDRRGRLGRRDRDRASPTAC